MKLMKRATALLLCFLMLTNGPISAFATEGVSDNDVVVETTTTTETVEVCEECGESDAHSETCSFNIAAPLTTETPDETTEPTTTPTEITEPATTPTVATGPAISTDPVGCTECNQTEGHLDSCSQYVAPTEETVEPTTTPTEAPTEPTVSGNDVVGCTECGQTEGHTTECSQYEDSLPQSTIYDDMMAAVSVDEMYTLLLDVMNNDPDALWNLTDDELTALYIYAGELNSNEESESYVDLCDTLQYLAGDFDLGEAVILAPIDPNQNINKGAQSVTIATGTISGNKTWTVGERFFFTGTVTIPTNATLTIKINTASGCANQSLVHKYDGGALFQVTGGKLVIQGSSSQKLVIDGRNNWSVDKTDTTTIRESFAPQVKSGTNPSSGFVSSQAQIYLKNGTVDIDYVEFKNIYNGGDGEGGAISVRSGNAAGNKPILTVDNSLFNHCATLYGGAAMHFNSANIAGTATVNNCEFKNCYTDNGGSIGYANKTTGGGNIRCIGTNQVALTLQNCTAYGNVSLGDGGFLFWNAGRALMTVTGCNFYNNMTAASGGAILIMSQMKLTNTTIHDNKAGSNAGGINVGTWGSATWVDPISFRPEAGDVTFGQGVKIYNNEAGDNGGGVYFSVRRIQITAHDDASKTKLKDAEEKPWYVKDIGNSCWYVKNDKDNKLYSMQLTIDGAEIYNNKAGNNGGGIYMTTSYQGYTVALNLLSGKISNNTASTSGGGVYITKVPVTFGSESRTDGITISGNKATKHGGGLYVTQEGSSLSKDVHFANSSILNNTAGENGGGMYLNSGNFIMSSGTVNTNKALNGGALYVNGGNITMRGGSISSNEATGTGSNGNGGAAYVADGNVTIEHGSLDSNKAVKGGAVYLAGSISTTMTMESGTMNSNDASDDGGAIYAIGGTIKIGLESCSKETAGADCSHHTAKGADRHHPVISENKAGDTGGGIALTEGVVHFYCGQAEDNQALYKGVGKNVFMDGGQFHLYDGADVGVPRDPDLVIIGGELHNECVNKEYLNLNYYFQNTDTDTSMKGLAELNEVMNLPDGEYFWDAPEGYVFLGWTAQGAASGNQSNEYVRNKEQYVNSGEPVEILDGKSSETDQTAMNTNRLFDGTSDKTLHLYALWVPETSNITYVNGLTGAIIPNTETDPDNPVTYTFNRNSNVITIQPVKHTGYDLVGWYIYQDAEQNANWNDTQADYENLKYEPNYSGTDYSTQKTYIELDSRNGVLSLEAGNTNFGDITLIAKFEPAYTDLKITKTGWQTIDENQTFIFKVTGQPINTELEAIDMTVTIQGNGFVFIKELPVGSYTVTEITDWSWRYTPDDETKEVQLVDSSKTEEVDFSNTRSNIYWLSGDSCCTNWWGGENGTVIKRKASN